MGMDVYGKQAKNETGEYFRRSVWSWRPLADYVCQVEPELTARCPYWQSNDGAGLDQTASETLAASLRAELASGRTLAYIVERDKWLASLPLIACELCQGTGVRRDEVGVRMGMVARNWCNGCDGKGQRKDIETWYGLDTDDVAEFASFLESCGGFSID
jgi:hypothetical protein